MLKKTIAILALLTLCVFAIPAFAEGEATVTAVGGQGALHRRLLDMGLTPGVKVTLQKTAPMGDPLEIHLRGYALTLRLEDARSIGIRP